MKTWRYFNFCVRPQATLHRGNRHLRKQSRGQDDLKLRNLIHISAIGGLIEKERLYM